MSIFNKSKKKMHHRTRKQGYHAEFTIANRIRIGKNFDFPPMSFEGSVNYSWLFSEMI